MDSIVSSGGKKILTEEAAEQKRDHETSGAFQKTHKPGHQAGVDGNEGFSLNKAYEDFKENSTDCSTMKKI